jgi:hypothetical protein
MGGCELDSCGSGQGRVACSCVHSNEFIDSLSILLASQVGLCSMELLSF